MSSRSMDNQQLAAFFDGFMLPQSGQDAHRMAAA
jgi:hypothetical protein